VQRSGPARECGLYGVCVSVCPCVVLVCLYVCAPVCIMPCQRLSVRLSVRWFVCELLTVCVVRLYMGARVVVSMRE